MFLATPDATSTPRRWKALALLCSALFMVILDASIVIVALPSIKQDLAFSASDLPWVMSGYALSFGGLLLLGGRSADILGRRRMFMAGTVLFVLTSLLCGFAWSDWTIIAARIVQGIAAAIMAPSALSILMTTFEEGPDRNKALGIWGAVGGGGGTAGWLVGGPLTTALGWRWIFFINIPMAICVLAFSPVLLGESRAQAGKRGLDPMGAATITVALFLLVYAVVKAPMVGWWNGQTLGLLALSAMLIALFVFIEGRSTAPLVPLHIFHSRTLVGGNLVALVLGIVAFGMPFILTQYAQQVLGMPARAFGISSAVMPIMASASSVAGQALVTRIGYRSIAAAGMAMMGAACLLLTHVSVDGSYVGDVLLPLLIFGSGLGAAGVAGSIAAFGGVAEEDAGLASGLNNAAFQIGGALGVAILSTAALSQRAGSERLAVLVQGSQAAFAVAAVFAALGIVVAGLLLGYQRRDQRDWVDQPAGAGS